MKYFYMICLILFLFLTWIYFNYFIYVDPLNGCFIATTPTFNFNTSKIKQAISAIKYNSPADYKNLCQRISYIETGDLCPPEARIAGCFIPTWTRTIDVKTYHQETFSNASQIENDALAVGYVINANNLAPKEPNSTAWISVVIIHELCHAMQKNEGRLVPGFDPEPECYAKNNAYAQLNLLPL